MKIDFPTKYIVKYPIENKKYYYGKNKEEMEEVLLTASKNFCMYCGKRLEIDGDKILQLEHSVDKDGNYNQRSKKTLLLHCKYNLAVSCVKCNEVYKKRIEKIDFNNYKDVNCPDDCCEMCNTYKKMRNEYISKNAIILQPQGITKYGKQYKIRYNLLKHILEPDDENYEEEAIFLIANHIDRFHLNGDRFSTCIIDICADIFFLYKIGVKDFNSLIKEIEQKRFSNILGVLFVKFLKENFEEKSIEGLIEFCKLLILLDSVV